VYRGIFVGRQTTRHRGSGSPELRICQRQEWDRVLDINLKGAFLSIKHGVTSRRPRWLYRQRWINFSAFQPAPRTASKHGPTGLTSSVFAELALQGIRADLVCPGFVDTQMHYQTRRLVDDDWYTRFWNRVFTRGARVVRKRLGFRFDNIQDR
jgi:NAD(P)-dependent dehydrogenase (short-subunit alcohol dehydrogenase family)